MHPNSLLLALNMCPSAPATPPEKEEMTSDDESATSAATSFQLTSNKESPVVTASTHVSAATRHVSFSTFVGVLILGVYVSFLAGSRSRPILQRYLWQQPQQQQDDVSAFWAKSLTSPHQRTVHEANWEATCKSSADSENQEEQGVCGISQGRYARHLILDMNHVELDFLNSPERLVRAMEQSAALSGTSLASHYCFTMVPMGVSCAGELLEEGRITFHTWPEEGVITMDFLTFSPRAPLPEPHQLRDVFGIQAGSEPVEMKWFTRSRALPTEDINAANDIFYLLSDSTVSKKKVASVETPFQTIDVYDVQGSINNAIPMTKYIKTRMPDKEPVERIIYLDGVMQSRQFGEAAYHELLVHPALFLHRNPKRVAIIGGGEGGTLREVLRHQTVEEAVMIEIDQLMVETSRQHIPQWSDCSNIVDEASSSDSCFDNPRARLYFEDAIKWFTDNYGDSTVERSADQLFDVIIMDALDPSDDVEFSDFLYKNDALLNAMMNALQDNGILIAQMGQAPLAHSQPESFALNNRTAEFIVGMERAGFESVLRYEDLHSRFTLPWAFFAALTDGFDRSRWYAGPAQVDLEIVQRIRSTYDGKPALQFFDGATMMAYQYSSKVFENVWCSDKPEECENGKQRFDPDVGDVPVSSFSLRQSTIPSSGRGVFADTFIPRGSYLGARDCVHGMFVPPSSLSIIDEMHRSTNGENEFWECLGSGYIDGYGWTEDFYGLPGAGVDPGIFTYVNHGCNGTYNSGEALPFTESSDGHDAELMSYDAYFEAYNPYYERRYSYPDCATNTALRDIEAGEEILCNYLVFSGSFGSADGNAEHLRKICAGIDVGLVTEYEARKRP